jgi:hypothetical protein
MNTQRVVSAFVFPTSKRLWLLILATCLGLTACNLPVKTSLTPTMDVTQAYRTVAARLTQALSLTPPLTPLPSPVLQPTTPPPPLTATNTAIPMPTQSPFPTSTPVCDRAAGGADIDVTIPDDAPMQPGQAFTKIWRLTNTGACVWTSEYDVVWFSGESLGAALSVPLSGNVAPGQTVDVAVDMVAPQQAGSYQGYWKLRNASNVLFGIGPSGMASFWVRIVVVQPLTATPTPTLTVTITPSLTPTVGSKASGPATLNPGDVLDLDTNSLNSGDEDLSYQLSGTSHLLDPVSGAAMAVFGNSQPTLANCQTITLIADAFTVENLTIGTYLCYRTSMGLPGWTRLTGFDASSGVLNLEIFTWAIP